MTACESFLESVMLFDSVNAKNLNLGDVNLGEILSDKPYWVHFSINNSNACKWLKDKSGIAPQLVESMIAKKSRPRVVLEPDSLVLILRVADVLRSDKLDELRSLRIYFDGNRIISTSLFPLPFINERIKAWKSKADINQPVKVFMDLISHSILSLDPILGSLHDRMDILERRILDCVSDPEDKDISTLALNALDLRRFLAPQREAFSQLCNIDLPSFTKANKKQFKESLEKIHRYLEELEVIRDRTRIIREQRNSHLAEQANQRLYLFSVAAFIFLPLSFLTGLLGVNLGGIPGADSPLGFVGFCGLLAVLLIAMILAFRRYRWL